MYLVIFEEALDHTEILFVLDLLVFWLKDQLNHWFEEISKDKDGKSHWNNPENGLYRVTWYDISVGDCCEISNWKIKWVEILKTPVGLWDVESERRVIDPTVVWSVRAVVIGGIHPIVKCKEAYCKPVWPQQDEENKPKKTVDVASFESVLHIHQQILIQIIGCNEFQKEK